MASGADEIGRALRGTALEGMPVRPSRNDHPEGFPFTPPDSDVLVIDGVEPSRVLEHWRTARDVLPSTSRWPIAVAPGWNGGFWKVPEDRLAELEGAIVGMDDSRMFHRFVFDVPTAQQDWRDGLDHVFPGAGLAARMAAELPDPVLDHEVDRWIHDCLMADPSLVALVEDRLQHHVGTRAWFEPDSVELAFLPTTSPWLAIEWVGYFGADHDQPAFVAALKRWHSTWGAELVAAWGTMLQFTVTRRPRQGDEAWELAGQLLAWAGSLQLSQWELALVLARSDTWFLHDRP
ncbi:DUF4253 domain-containing protein [Cellulomonas sp. Leaf334]|uniref:DUF4253 domain-containing protein n=1 Tax=Cellulomonas sp. Leaf334 TaxID=1736339 RepID=UPI0006F9DE2B|nr:DUF4253 domain-containing protein [Cellulomonas sp. Leaf334]KQR08598.1 hypothetical protein ASF78_20390 [Cellulomonas sp. Leaf334]